MLLKKMGHFALMLWLSALLPVRGANYSVTVGGPGILQFNPSTVNAVQGDMVIFTFKQSNHTATQSTFENPCQMAPGGFDTGFIPVADDNTDGPFPAAQFTVEDSDPVWVYCQQADHCQQGMVFAINPGNQFPAFQAAAMGTSLPSATIAGSTATASPPPSSSLSSPSQSSPSSIAEAPATFSSVSQPSGSPGSAAPTSATSTNHKVVVGGPNKLAFAPSNISAQAGDTVTFQFLQTNHTATQSTFEDPCIGLSQTSTSGQIGFDSGFMPVVDNATTFPTFTITINDTTPIWAFCKQVNHCGQGMVFSVNAVESGPDNFTAFQARAIQQNGTTSNTTSSGTTRFAVGSGAGIAASVVAALIGGMI